MYLTLHPHRSTRPIVEHHSLVSPYSRYCWKATVIFPKRETRFRRFQMQSQVDVTWLAFDFSHRNYSRSFSSKIPFFSGNRHKLASSHRSRSHRFHHQRDWRFLYSWIRFSKEISKVANPLNDAYSASAAAQTGHFLFVFFSRVSSLAISSWTRVLIFLPIASFLEGSVNSRRFLSCWKHGVENFLNAPTRSASDGIRCPVSLWGRGNLASCLATVCWKVSFSPYFPRCRNCCLSKFRNLTNEKWIYWLAFSVVIIRFNIQNIQSNLNVT